MNSRKRLNKIRTRRGSRTKAKISGTSKRPRISVFRSNRYIYAQLIDDEKGRTMASASSVDLKKSSAAKEKDGKASQAERVGEALAQKAVAAGIKQAIFDRGSYKYHGRVKAVAEGARKGGLKI